MVEIDLAGLVLPERVETVDRSPDGRSARFAIAPLERGFGHTLGNSVRRVLLSSLRGAAVWAFRIDGVLHEHQTIPGVVEDVHQIIANLKNLVLILDADADEAVLSIQVSSRGAVTAAHIKAPPTIAILNPGHHLLTLEEDRELNIQLHVNKGRGFVLADQHVLPRGSPVDMVRIDALYNPVRRANFTVEETRVGQRTDFDRLTLAVETDGSLTPETAVAYAAELVRRHLDYLKFFGGELPRAGTASLVAVPEKVEELLHRSIEDLAELSVRSRNSLQKESITTVLQLVQRTEDEMLQIDNFGKKSLQEIKDFLLSQGLHFGMRLREEGGRLHFADDEAALASSVSVEG